MNGQRLIHDVPRLPSQLAAARPSAGWWVLAGLMSGIVAGLVAGAFFGGLHSIEITVAVAITSLTLASTITGLGMFWLVWTHGQKTRTHVGMCRRRRVDPWKGDRTCS